MSSRRIPYFIQDVKDYFLHEYKFENKDKPFLSRLGTSLWNTFLYDLGTTIAHIGYLDDKYLEPHGSLIRTEPKKESK